MSFQVHAEIPVDKLSGFFGDLEQAIDDWKEELMRQFKNVSRTYSFNLSKTRMPSGDSYRGHIKWRRVLKTRWQIVSELYNDHQWARAVERGTEAHPITSDKLMTAYPMLVKAKVATAHGTRGYGTRYGGRKAYGYFFDHPGTRAFHIFRDTARFVNGRVEHLVKRSGRRVGIKW